MINDFKTLCDRYGDDFDWMTVSGSDSDFVRELHRELAADHPLYGLALLPLAKCESNDDVLFCMDCRSDKRCFIVHLSYSAEYSSPFPLYIEFDCLEKALTYIEAQYIKEHL